MKKFMVQVQLGSMFEDLSVIAKDWDGAVEAAKQLVASNDSLKIFRHRFASYVV